MSDLRDRIPGLASGVLAVFSALAACAAPQQEISVSQWAEKHRHVASESGSAAPGKWKNDRAPYLAEVMDACELGNGIRRVVLTGGAQFGKSDAILNSIFHAADTNPRKYLVLLPSLKEVQTYSETKWDCNVAASPRLGGPGGCIFRHKSRSSDGSTQSVKRYRGASLELTTAAASKGLQMRTVACVVGEEIDQYELTDEGAVGVGGDPIVAAEGRMKQYGDDAKTILASTPGFAGRSRIWAEFLASDQRKWFTPCPHEECGAFSILDFGTFSLMEGRPCFSCTACGGVIEASHKKPMNALGVWVPTFEHPEPVETDESEEAASARAKRERNPAPPKTIPAADIDRWRNRDCEGRPRGYHLWEAQSNFSSWSIIWDNWLALKEGRAVKGADIEFAQKTLGIPFEKKVDRPDDERLHGARGVLYPTARIGVPEWAWLVTGAIDVQHNRLEWALYAWGKGGVGARIAFGVIPKNPLTWATWSEDVKRLVDTQVSGPNFRPRLADYWFVDSGGNATENVYNFCMPLQYRPQPVLVIKGDSHDRGDAPALRKGNLVKVRRGGVVIGKVTLWFVGTHGLKARVYEGLAQGIISAESGKLEPRSLHFPKETTREEFKQLTAEHLKKDDPRERGRWEKPQGVANEQLDLCVYAMSAAINAGLDLMDEMQWASLASARAPDKVVAELTPLELLALPDDHPARIAAEVQTPKLEPPPAEGVNRSVTEDDLAAVEAMGAAWGAG
jgi:phage terminase large subunit GpA-like protein